MITPTKVQQKWALSHLRGTLSPPDPKDLRIRELEAELAWEKEEADRWHDRAVAMRDSLGHPEPCAFLDQTYMYCSACIQYGTPIGPRYSRLEIDAKLHELIESLRRV